MTRPSPIFNVVASINLAYQTHAHLLSGILEYVKTHTVWTLNLIVGRRDEQKRFDPSTLDGLILYGKIPSWLNKADLCKTPTVMIEPIREPDFPCCRVCCDNAPVAVTGTTIAEKVTRLRIDRAKQLLKASNVSLERIATACGFYNASHLSAAFLRCVGVRPSVFRDSL